MSTQWPIFPFLFAWEKVQKFKTWRKQYLKDIKSDHMIKFDSVCLNLDVNLLADVTQIRL